MYDRQRKAYTRSSIDEGRGIIQAEEEGIVQNPERLTVNEQKYVDLDYRCDGKYKFVDEDSCNTAITTTKKFKKFSSLKV